MSLLFFIFHFRRIYEASHFIVSLLKIYRVFALDSESSRSNAILDTPRGIVGFLLSYSRERETERGRN